LSFLPLVEVRSAFRAARDRQADPNEQSDFSQTLHVFSSDTSA
jgi:hypothetical protein